MDTTVIFRTVRWWGGIFSQQLFSGSRCVGGLGGVGGVVLLWRCYYGGLVLWVMGLWWCIGVMLVCYGLGLVVYWCYDLGLVVYWLFRWFTVGFTVGFPLVRWFYRWLYRWFYR